MFNPEKINPPTEEEKKSTPVKEIFIEETKENGLKVIDVKPKETVFETPVIMAPGWGNTAQAMQKSLEVFGESGRRAMSLNHKRKKNLESISEEVNESTETLQRAIQILETLDQKKIEGSVNGVGYSEGGIDLITAAWMAPERFKELVLVAPGGMVGKDGRFRLVGRFLHGTAKDSLNMTVKPETIMPALRYTKELTKYIAKNPLMAYREIETIAQSDITWVVKELVKKGVNISFVCGADDKTFPMYKENKDGSMKEKSVQYQAGKTSQELKEEKEGAFFGFYSVKGGHGELILHPEKYTKVVEEILETREK